MEHLKEVYFGEYCKRCKHRNTKEYESPCDECLSVPGREDSHKPLYFETKRSETSFSNKQEK